MTDLELDRLYNDIEYLISRARLDWIDSILYRYYIRISDAQELDIDEMITYLTASKPVKNSLNNYYFLLNYFKRLKPDNSELWNGLE